MGAQMPEFSNTPVEDIPKIVAQVRDSFFTKRTRDVEFRIQQLRKLYWGLEDNKEILLEACQKDLHKPVFEAKLAELTWVQNDVIFMSNNLRKWAADEKPDDMAFSHKLVSPRIRKDPLGTVLVIG
jgi:beta-apo-4'-carotenal oxygenase